MDVIKICGIGIQTIFEAVFRYLLFFLTVLRYWVPPMSPSGRLSPDRGPTINTPFLRYIPYLSLKNGIPFHIRNNLTFHFLININKSVAPGKGIRGIQPRFPPKFIENTFQAIQSIFLDLQKCILSGAIKFVSVRSSQGNLSLFEIQGLQDFLLPEILDAIQCIMIKKKKNIVDSSLHHIFEYENFRFRFPYDKWPNLGCDM